jgi:excisionase family DNA binding protein
MTDDRQELNRMLDRLDEVELLRVSVFTAGLLLERYERELSAPPPEPPTAAAPRPQPLLYNIRDAATRLGTSDRTVYQLIYDEKLRKVKQGRRTFVRADDVARYIDEQSEDD